MTRAMTNATTATPATPRRALAACAFAALLCGSAFAQGGAPSEDVIETAKTPAGELSLVRRRQEEAVTIVIKLGGRVFAEKSASREGDSYRDASVYGTYPRAAPRYALVRLTVGALTCGSKFTVVDLSREGKPRASEDFGNCSDVPRAAYRAGALTVTFPAGPRRRDPGAYYVGPRQVWTYRAGRLRRVAGGR